MGTSVGTDVGKMIYAMVLELQSAPYRDELVAVGKKRPKTNFRVFVTDYDSFGADFSDKFIVGSGYVYVVVRHRHNRAKEVIYISYMEERVGYFSEARPLNPYN